VAKNTKRNGARAVIDRALTNPDLMSVIPFGSSLSAGYGALKALRIPKSVKTQTASPCLKKWFDCVSDPFSQNAQGACIPFGSNLSSNRYMGYVRGDITIGTGGVGLLVIAPSPYNDVHSLWVSNVLFAGTDATWVTALNTLAGGITPLYVSNNRFSANSVLAYNGTQRDMPLQARLVGGGVKLYYTGTELNKSGLMSMYTNPSHQNATYGAGGVASSTSTLGALQETYIVPVSREPVEYPLTPLCTPELEYFSFAVSTVGVQAAMSSFAYPWASNQIANGSAVYTVPSGLATLNTAGSASTCILVTGVPGQTIHFEYAMHVEAVGDLTEGQRLPADSDPMGVDAMMAALSRLQIERNSRPHLTTANVLRSQYSDVCRMRDTKVRL